MCTEGLLEVDEDMVWYGTKLLWMCRWDVASGVAARVSKVQEALDWRMEWEERAVLLL